MRVLFVALALALAASAAAQPVTMQMAVESINTQTADADGRFVGVAAGGFMDGEDPLTVTYTRVPYPLGGDVAPDLNPTPGAFNGALVDVEGQAYVVLNQRGEDIKNTDGTANRFAMHAFTFTAPIFLPRNSIAITDLDFDHVGANGFHDAFALIVMDEAGNMVNLQGTTPSELEGTEGQEGLGVIEYTAAFPGADIGDIIETDGPDFSQFTELISYTNARDPTIPDPQLDPNGERGHDNTNNGVSFRTRARDGFPDGLRAIFVVYWNTFADTADENGQGICVRDGEFFLEAQADGDPHMVGFMGQHFNVLGEGGSVYNLVSTPHMQYNARFNSTQFTHKGKHATLISEMGVMVGDNHVRVFFPSAQSEELVMEVNGERIASDDHRMIMLSEDGEEWVMRTPGEERHVVIVTKAFHFNVHGQLQRLRHLDDGVKLVDWVSGSTAHGLLGQTANAAKVQKDQKEFVADFDWPWYLDGSLADYVVADGIFGTEFTYNQYEAL